MKSFACFFALYVFCLCTWPCQDNGEHVEFSGKSIQKEGACNGDDHSNCNHKCSPFCFCNCCQVITEVSIAFNIHKIITTPVVCYTPYVESRLPEVALLIWQPPKINS